MDDEVSNFSMIWIYLADAMSRFQAENDIRIAKLVEFVEKNGDDPDAVVQLLESLGGESAMIYGGMCFNKDFSMSHFLIMAVLHIRGDGKKLTSQVKLQRFVLFEFFLFLSHPLFHSLLSCRSTVKRLF
jgi:hypothetical protein